MAHMGDSIGDYSRGNRVIKGILKGLVRCWGELRCSDIGFTVEGL